MTATPKGDKTEDTDDAQSPQTEAEWDDFEDDDDEGGRAELPRRSSVHAEADADADNFGEDESAPSHQQVPRAVSNGPPESTPTTIPFTHAEPPGPPEDSSVADHRKTPASAKSSNTHLKDAKQQDPVLPADNEVEDDDRIFFVRRQQHGSGSKADLKTPNSNIPEHGRASSSMPCTKLAATWDDDVSRRSEGEKEMLAQMCQDYEEELAALDQSKARELYK